MSGEDVHAESPKLRAQLFEDVRHGRTIDCGAPAGVDWDNSEHQLSAGSLRSLLIGPSGPALDPRGLRLVGARISGRLDLSGVTIPIPIALLNCHLPDGLDLSRSAAGLVDLRGSLIESNTLGAINVASARIGTLDLHAAIVIGKATGHSAVNLRNTHIADDLIMTEAIVSSEGTGGVLADNLTVGGSARLQNMQVDASGETADALRLNNARVSGQIELISSRLDSRDGAALDAQGLVAGLGLNLAQLSARGAGAQGAVTLVSAQIGKQLLAPFAQLENASGPALTADGIRVDGDLNLYPAMHADSDSPLGCLRLNGAHVAGQASLTGATLSNKSGACLALMRASIDMDAYIDEITVSALDRVAGLKLQGLRIGGNLTLTGSVVNDQGSAISLEGARIAGDAQLGLRLRGGGSDNAAILDLTRTTIGGALKIGFLQAVGAHKGVPSLALDGLTYQGLPQLISLQDWLSWIRHQTAKYAAQPYRHLAAASQAGGHDSDTKTILIAQRRDQLARASTSRRERAWGFVTGLTLGYGYRPGRALGLLAILAVIASLGALCAAHHGVLLDDYGDRCGRLESIAYGLSASVPILELSSPCDPGPTRAGAILTASGWVVQVFSWAFATLFIAGFTGAVRRV